MEEMRGELKGVFILFKLTSPLTHQGVAGEDSGSSGGWGGVGGWGGGEGHNSVDTHKHAYTQCVCK